jgi:hypothetical protein
MHEFWILAGMALLLFSFLAGAALLVWATREMEVPVRRTDDEG